MDWVFNHVKKLFILLGMVEPDLLECEVKRALGRITMNKLVKVMEFQWSYFKS